MKCELTKLEGLKRKLQIQLSADQVQEILDQNYRKWQKKVNLQGFRKGKVPLQYIQSHYQPEVKKDTTIDLINTFYKQAVLEKQITPVGDPKIDFKKPPESGQDFNFSALLEIHPAITVDKNFKVQLKKEKVEISEEAVEKSIYNLRMAGSQLEPVTENRVVQMDDIVELEWKAPKSDKETVNILNKILTEKPVLEITEESKDTPLKGLLNGIVGMSVGDTKDISCVFSKDFSDQRLSGAGVELSVQLMGIKKRILPLMDENFFQKMGCKTEEELKKQIRNYLTTEKERVIYENKREQILEQLVKKYPIELLPETVLKEQKQLLQNNMFNHLKSQGMKEKDIIEYNKKNAQELEKQAQFTIRSSYLIYALADVLQLSVTDQDAQHYLRQTKSKQSVEEVKHLLIREKVIAHLIHSAERSEQNKK